MVSRTNLWWQSDVSKATNTGGHCRWPLVACRTTHHWVWRKWIWRGVGVPRVWVSGDFQCRKPWWRPNAWCRLCMISTCKLTQSSKTAMGKTRDAWLAARNGRLRRKTEISTPWAGTWRRGAAHAVAQDPWTHQREDTGSQKRYAVRG